MSSSACKARWLSQHFQGFCRSATHLPQFKIQLAVSISNHSIFQATNSSPLPSFLFSLFSTLFSHFSPTVRKMSIGTGSLSPFLTYIGSCERKGFAGSSGEEPAKVLIAHKESRWCRAPASLAPCKAISPLQLLCLMRARQQSAV